MGPLLLLSHAFARDLTGKYADSPNKKWYENQRMTREAGERIGWRMSCCSHGDVFRTKFKVVENGTKYGIGTYLYWKDNRWNVIPPDIIQRKPTPDGKPILFLYKGTDNDPPYDTPICFIIGPPGT